MTFPMTRLLDWLFPPKCLSCKEFLEDTGRFLCPHCRTSWLDLDPPYCTRCACPFPSSPGPSHLCGDCLKGEKACTRVDAVGLYEGVLHDLIIRLKFRQEERLGYFLGRAMAEEIVSRGETEGLPSDLILPIPLHRDRLRERGFNQALLFAREVGTSLRVPVDPGLLTKKRKTEMQTRLKGEERRKNLKGAFAVAEPDRVGGKRILLIDDVYTTGATIEEAAKTLLKQGAEEVRALVLARAV